MSNSKEQTKEYALGYSKEEARRLDLQHIVARRASGDRLISPYLNAAVQAGHIKRVLDIGCGTGIWCYETAIELRSSGISPISVVGLDISENKHWPRFDRLPVDSNAGPASVTFDVADLNNDEQMLSVLEKHGGPFDLIHSRHLVSAIKKGQWDAYFHRIFKLLRPGGYIQLTEFDVLNCYPVWSNLIASEMVCLFFGVYNYLGLEPLCAISLAPRAYNAGFCAVAESLNYVEHAKRLSDGTIQIDQDVFDWITGSWDIFRPLFVKARQHPEYATFLQDMPKKVYDNAPGGDPTTLLRNEEEYNQFVQQLRMALASTTDIYRAGTLLRTLVAQKPE